MKRRQLLRGGAAAAVGAGAALAGLSVASEPADAQASTTLDVAGDDVMLDSGGSIAAVWLTVDVDWSYAVPDGRQPSTVIVEIAAGKSDGELTTVGTTESAELFLEADGTEAFDVDLLAQGALDSEAITPDSGERSTDVTVESRLRVENADGDVLASADATDTATLGVEKDSYNATEYGGVGGSGGLTIEPA